MRSWLEKDFIEMHSMYNEEKSVIIETLKNKIHKSMTSIY